MRTAPPAPVSGAAAPASAASAPGSVPGSATGPASAAGPGAASGSAGDLARRRELAAFLRSRRERITPERAGLPRGPRRRTPGLRREEVAQLSAVGVTWYTWLEQGRDIQVSAQVLDALARALMMDASERAHLFALGGTADPTPAGSCPEVSAPLRAMLVQLEPYPACVQNARYDILAYNRTYRRLITDLDPIPPENRNCMWLAFNDPDWGGRLVDRDRTTRLMVANFRARMAEHLAEPAWKAMLARMRRSSEEFRRLWDRHEVVQNTGRTKGFHNGLVGTLTFHYEPLWPVGGEGHRLSVYVPSDDESRERVERLHRLVS